ncbi:Spc97 / Spc98 family [Novymonas esmeraldas]|uniref:Spindle pole body component n=1 Tax=Novymonas esmeraldas TaxID=1808958 RepID=A0AAW0EKQ9_9TRYP
MEEVKCSLLGFHSALLQQPLAAAAGATVQRESLAGDRGGAAGGAPSAAAAAALRQYCETLPFHPTEQLLLQRALPLGRVYHSLLRATQAAAVGRTEGLYPAAIASGVKRILGNYVEAVKAAETPSALAALPATYELTFTLLERMVQQQQRVEECLPMLDCFLRHQEVPPAFRRFLGESVWLALLYTTAHYVAHGVVLHARPDYFVALRTKPAEGAPAASGSGAEEHVLFTDRLPPGVSTELGLLILAAGKERRVLLRDTDVQGGSDYLEQLALGSQDEAANAVFHSVFNAQLCHGGVLAAEELAARVEAAKTLWSRALWMKVGDVPALKVHLGALRSMFLCHRGDVWYAFVERVLPALAGVQSVRHGGRRDAERAPVSQLTSLAPPTGIRIDGAAAAGANEEEEEEEASGAAGRVSRAAAARAALLQRTTADAFFFALSVSNLRDVAAYDTFTMRVAPASLEEADAALASVMQSRSGQHPRSSSNSGGGGGGSDAAAVSTEDMARHLLLVVQALHLQCIPPQGLMLVVSPKAMQYYQRLFSFHLALRFSLEALAVTRSLFAEALVTNACPSPDLRRAFSLFQLLHFMESSIGYYMQVDVISVCTAKLEEQLASAACTSVDQAKRFHDQFIWRVSEATFLTEGSEPLLRACQSLNTCATTLYTLCMRYRIPYWAVEGVNDTPVEVRATLSALEARVQQEVVAVFTGHLGLGARPWERALWSRLDFNAYFSQTRARPAVPVALRSASASATTFAHPRQTRPHGTSTPSRTGSATAAAATTRRHTIFSKRASGG